MDVVQDELCAGQLDLVVVSVDLQQIQAEGEDPCVVGNGGAVLAGLGAVGELDVHFVGVGGADECILVELCGVLDDQLLGAVELFTNPLNAF